MWHVRNVIIRGDPELLVPSLCLLVDAQKGFGQASVSRLFEQRVHCVSFFFLEDQETIDW